MDNSKTKAPPKLTAAQKKQQWFKLVGEIAKDANRHTTGWYQSKIKEVLGHKPTKADLFADSSRKTGKIVVGRMYFFAYSPKTADTLPYYDEFPLVLPFDHADGGFIGINLHYVPYNYRQKILWAIMETQGAHAMEKDRIKTSWRLLRRLSSVPALKHCVKRYLGGHVRSKFIEVSPSEFFLAAVLPVAAFKKAKQTKVWTDSLLGR